LQSELFGRRFVIQRPYEQRIGGVLLVFGEPGIPEKLPLKDENLENLKE
jgi:hypothetical protein